jgi:hypothetical protein
MGLLNIRTFDMKIEIEIPDMHVKLLSQWASVGRTLRTAEAGFAQASDPQEITNTDREKYNHCANELADLIPALEELHRVVRQAMWNIANRTRAVEALQRTTVTQRREAIAIMRVAPNPLYFDVINAICDELGVPRTLSSEAVIDWLQSLDPATGEVATNA